MSNEIARKVGLGKGWHNTGTTVASADYNTDLEGIPWEGPDMANLDSAGTPAKLRSHRKVLRLLVRNVCCAGLPPKRLVAWASGYRGKRVDSIVRLPPDGTAGVGEVAGVVDEFWPSGGVPYGELFWLVVKGPALVLNGLAGDATNAFSVGDRLCAATAATSGSTNGITNAGRIREVGTLITTAATGVTAAYIARYAFGTAQSAKTADNTNANVLVEMDCKL